MVGMKAALWAMLWMVLCIWLTACTDAQKATFSALGEAGHITCYFPDGTIREWDSTGKIETESQSDGWRFMNAKTKRLIRVSGACVIEN